PIATPAPSSAPTPEATPGATPSPTPGTTPPGAIEIASGVTLVGEPAYNADGTWLAFSARPADNSAGPDLYLWRVGDLAATKVTDDHGTYFSAWLNGQVLGSTVAAPAEPAEPGASGKPGAPDEAPATTPEPTAEPVETDPDGSPDASAGPEPLHPRSFLLDPETGVRTELAQPDVWLPVVDPAGRFTAYWSGTLLPTADGLDWQLAEGRLVLDQWLDGDEPPAIPGVSAEPTAEPTEAPSVDPAADPSAAPAPLVGPAGNQVELEVGDIAAFQAKFDPDGLRIAFWVADDPSAEVGRLHLFVLDPATGTVDTTIAPLPGEPALRRFSIDRGRLAWVSPRGQDGQESAVQVLAWNGREFGEIQAIPAKDLFIVR
ncbi:MAG TPA: hypothetical protein VNL94_04840, partial [Candidatus Binatia bacterium]|nr:hypothetical protein [Candidatus Binatia bacterium]